MWAIIWQLFQRLKLEIGARILVFNGAQAIFNLRCDLSRLPSSSFALRRSFLLPTSILLPLILSQRCVTSLEVALNSSARAKTKMWQNSLTIGQCFPRKCVRIFSFSLLSSRPKPFVPLFNTTVSAAPEPLWSSRLRSRGLRLFPQSCLLKLKASPPGALLSLPSANSCFFLPFLLQTDTLLLGAEVGPSQAGTGPFQIFQQQEPIIVMRQLCSPFRKLFIFWVALPSSSTCLWNEGRVRANPRRSDSRLFGDDRTMIADERKRRRRRAKPGRASCARNQSLLPHSYL